MVLAEMEKPLLSVVLEYTRGNQTRAAEILTQPWHLRKS